MQYQDLAGKNLENHISFDDHEILRKVVLDPAKNIYAYIAVHNTNLGPSLGGCRMMSYAGDDMAIDDVLRLARGMTYKNAMAGLPLGGGKSVIIGNARTDKDHALMEKMGEAVETLKGRYITAEDSGTGEEDMVTMAKKTSYVTGLPTEEGALGGNPSPVTAWGVFHGIKAALKHARGSDNLRGLKVSVQGVGAVGIALCELLAKEGVKLVIADVNETSIASARKFGNVEVVAPDAIYSVEADIFSPNALGGVLNDDTIPQIGAKIVAGASNNQLRHPDHDRKLRDRGILYVPDYVINPGGVICVAYEYFKTSGYNPMNFTLTRQSMMDHVRRTGQSVTDVLNYAKSSGMSPGEAADRLAQQKFMSVNPEPAASRA